jgi:diguanylate cyclase (GGDEF)-like protein
MSLRGRTSGLAALPAGPADSPCTMARVLAALFFAGATIGAFTLLLPHPTVFDDAALWSNVVIAYVAALAITASARWLPAWTIQVAVAVGTLVVTRAVYYSGDPSSFYSLWYLWIGLYAFFFFGRFWGSLHVALVAAAYAWTLTQVPQTTPLARWVMTVTTIAIAAVLMDVLAGRVRRGAAEAASSARALSSVSSVAHELARTTSPEVAAPAVCDAAVEVADAAGAILFEPAGDGSGLIATASTDPEMAGTVLPFVSRPSGAIQAFTSGEPFFVADARGHADLDQRIVERLGVASALFQPVSRDRTPIGVMAIYWQRRLARLAPETEKVIQLLSVEAAIAIERVATLARLERVARTDDLTGLANRRAWDEQLRRELSRAKRDSTPLSVAMLDLDHFKRYNDRFGHQAGDRLLKETTAGWEALIRDTDLLARYGGEEFAVALPGAGMEDALALLERLRLSTPKNEKISAGVVCWDGTEDEAELIARADRALYAAKRAGRDRVVTA